MKILKTMKNSGLLLLVAGLLVTMAPSCKKDSNGGAGGNAVAGTITAKADGTSFTTATMVTMATKAANMLNIQGNTINTTTDNHSIVFTLNGVDGPGTYEFGGNSTVMNTAVYNRTQIGSTSPDSWLAPYESSVAGEIKISEITDVKVVGTFSFKAQNKDGNKSIIDISGSFNVNFQ